MPDVFELSPITVIGTQPSNPFMFMWVMMDLAQTNPVQVVIVWPQQGVVNGHTITVQWEGAPPLKPSLVNAQITRLRDAYVRVGNVIAGLSDSAIYQFGPVQLSGADLKAAYFALNTITVTDDIYGNGYGGRNFGSELRIGVGTSAGWGVHGEGAYNFIMLHEMAHNSVPGRALAQQMWDRHLAAGGTSATYGANSAYFQQQESMTNSLVRQIGDQIGVNYDSTTPNSPGYPKYGYYTGPELTPHP